MEHQLRLLIQKVTKEIPYLKMDEQKLTSYITSYIDSFTYNKTDKEISESFLSLITFTVSLKNISDPYKQTVKELIQTMYHSPITLYNFSYKMSSGLVYFVRINSDLEDENLFEWLRKTNYPNLQSLELRWNFLDEKSKRYELFTNIRSFASRELEKTQKRLASSLEEFKQYTNQLLAELTK